MCFMATGKTGVMLIVDFDEGLSTISYDNEESQEPRGLLVFAPQDTLTGHQALDDINDVTVGLDLGIDDINALVLWLEDMKSRLEENKTAKHLTDDS